MEHHHWIWIISRSGSSWNIIIGSRSSLDLDHCWLSSLDLDHPWCYLMILLVIGSSTEPAIFHAGCRPSLHVGLFQHLHLINTWCEEWLIISIWSTQDVKIDNALTSDQHMIQRMACPALTSDLLVRKACPTLTSNNVVKYNPIRKAQHSHSPSW